MLSLILDCRTDHEWVATNSFPSSENSMRLERSTSSVSTIC